METVTVIMGTRPEAIKLCPVVRQLRARTDIRTLVLATGQHDELLTDAMACFDIKPDESLSLSQPSGLGALTGQLLEGIDSALRKQRPDFVLVQGDTASAYAGALAGFYQAIPVAHVEAGLRTYHIRSPFPEEMHRRGITMLADLHFAPTASAKRNLLREGVPEKRVYLTGNTVIDALKYSLVSCTPVGLPELPQGKRLILFTAHRRENWGGPMLELFRALRRTVESFPDTYAVCPLHPNPVVRKAAEQILSGCGRIAVIDPPPLTVFHHLLARSTVVLTDSGGIQEETCALGIPTLVMRHSTERAEGIRAGCLRLVGTDADGIFASAAELLRDGSETYASMRHPSGVFGDGNASERIVRILAQRMGLS